MLPPSPHPRPWHKLRQRFMVGLGLAAVLLLLWWGDFFTQTRLRLNDVYFVSQETSGQVIIIAIDDESLQAYGRSPVLWPRSIYADLLRIIQAGGARVAALDVLFAEPATGDDDLLEAITYVRNSAPPLRVLMPAVGVEALPQQSPDGRIHYRDALLPLAEYRAAIENVGFVNAAVDRDGTIRRHLSQMSADADDERGYGFSIATYLAYTRISPSLISQLPHVMLEGDGFLQINESLRLPIDERGAWMPTFFGAPSGKEGLTFEVYSLRAVLEGEIDPSVFADKAVLVGLMNSTGLADTYPVPTSRGQRPMAGVEIIANGLETLIQNKPLREQSALSQILMIVLLSLAASLLYSLTRWYVMLPLALVALALWALLAFLIFDSQGLMLNLFHAGLALLLPLVISIGLDASEQFQRRRRAEFLLANMLEVSSQRLELRAVLPRFVADLRQVTDAPRGSIWLWQEDLHKFEAVYVWPEGRPLPLSCPPICYEAKAQAAPLHQDEQLALPLMWRDRMIGGVHMEHVPARRARRGQRQLLDRLASQAAPMIENAVLYTQTQRQNAVMSAILTHSPGGILVLDETRAIQRSNLAVDTALDVNQDTYFGQSFEELLLKANVPSDVRERFKRHLDADSTFRESLKLGRKTYQVDAARLAAIKRWVLLLNDVSALVELNDLKTHMIRMASHDLKNPLSNILGYVEMILDGSFGDFDLDPELRSMLERVSASAQDMHRIITDILDLEQLRAGLDQSTWQILPLENLLLAVTMRYKAQANDRGQSLLTEVETGLFAVKGSERQLIQAFANLIGNALKYTPDGGRVVVRLSERAGHAHIEIQDNGYGIPKEAQARLFEQFYRVRSSTTSHIKGTGLGLSLVKATLEAHGGKVWVESEADQGSTFFVELPLHSVPNSASIET